MLDSISEKIDQKKQDSEKAEAEVKVKEIESQIGVESEVEKI